MNTADETGFVRDLARMIAKYGPKPFTELADTLSDPQKREQIVNMLAAFADASSRKASRAARPRRPTPTEREEEVIRNISTQDTERGALLSEAGQRLLRTPKPYLLDIAARLEVANKESDTPSLIVSRIIHYLSGMAAHEMRNLIASYNDLIPRKGGELRAWNDIITGGQRSRPARQRSVVRK